ncbi:YndJ family protein [Actinoplanes aureus]|uniref:YndJ family protein n=1 Tax=Actinoplanes aureus TaxID=2792083 RepID=A0A931CM12_9ACTN|nr:YndJ family protein [Actinoplanes aureus]MBG0568856.1 YndJ family protein [Actinoplanes aureus]
MWVLVNLLVMVGMLVVVPGGLRLLDDSGLALARRVWPYGAAGAVCLWLPRGPVATGFAVIYAVAAGVLCAYAARFSNRGWRAQIAWVTALVSPGVAASALVAERAGYALFGFEPGVLALTVAHFHFAGFAAALIAGLHRQISPGRWADAAALTVPAGTMLVLLGYFTGEFVELAGALVLTAGMWTVGWLTWTHARSGRYDRLTAALLGTSAVVLAASMVLAVSWALGEATGIPHPSLAWMAATHGVANALGFAVCGIAGWRRVRDRQGAGTVLSVSATS